MFSPHLKGDFRMKQKQWIGAAGVCMNEQGELLMVLQGTPEEEKKWSVPSGGKEPSETIECCCLREIKEETGYDVRIKQSLHKKETAIDEYTVTVHYFEVEIIGGKEKIQDPDHLIYDIAWKSADDIENLRLSFPEDRSFLIDYINKNRMNVSEK